MKRNVTIITLAMVALVSMASLGFAGHGKQGGFGNGSGDCMGPGSCNRGPGYRAEQIAQLTPEKQEAYRNIMKEFRDKMTPIREAMWEKRLELKALSPNPNVQPAEIKALVGEIGALHTQMRTEHESLRNRLETEIGLKLGKGGFQHPQRGKGMRGNKGQMGNGQRMMDGSGPGCPNAQ